jgi:uncharacterized protein YlaI
MLDADSLENRARQADRIVRNPAKYKVCVGCESIVAAKTAICPNCHSYRYEFDEDRVIAQAQVLGQRPRQSVLASDLH